MKKKFLVGVFLAVALFWGQGILFGQDDSSQEDVIAQSRYQELAGRRTISINVKKKPLQELLKFIAGKANVNILVDPEIQEKVTIRLINVYWKNALQVIAERANCVVEQISPNLFKVTKPPRVSMEFAGAELSAVLDLLARQAGSNIIISSQVTGKVTLNLRDVHWKQALETIVKTSGFVAVEEEGNIIRIVRRESLRDQLETEIITLRYVRPPGTYRAAITSAGTSTKGGVFFVGDARPPGDPASTFTLYKAILGAIDPAIQETVIYDPISNSFVIRATKLTLNRVKQIISKVDKEPLQVFIDVKFIKTDSDSLVARGLRFTDPNAKSDGFVARGVFDNTNAAGAVTQPGELGPNTTPLPVNLRGMFPFELGDMDTFTRRFRVPMVLDFTQTLAILRLVKSNKNIRIVQAPSLMTLNHQEATIFVGENVPFAEQQTTIDPNGGPPSVTLQAGNGSPISVGFHLFITPHVIPDTNKVMLQVIPKSNFLSGPDAGGFRTFTVSGNQITLPQTQEQVVVTNLMVSDGKTAVIGGLLSETKTEAVSKVPILSSIPILGNLFTYRSMQTKLENLIIFITPTVVRDTDQLSIVSRRRIINFGKLDYFKAKEEGRARDGVFDERPVVKEAYEGILGDLYKDEDEHLKLAESTYKDTIQKVDEALSQNRYNDAMVLLEGYPYNYKATTKYGRLVETKAKDVQKAKTEFLKQQALKKKKPQDE